MESMQAMLVQSSMLSLLIGSLCHDVGHTGRNNSFEVALETELATLYNNQSVLENYHAAFTCRLLRDPESSILCSLESATRRQVCQNVVDMILATDMSKHTGMLEALASPDVFGSDNGARKQKQILEVVVHLADLSNPVRAAPPSPPPRACHPSRRRACNNA
jgi:hypothetical protein